MANYTTVVTDAGIALLTRIANAAGTLEFRSVKCGDGQIGVGDPEALTDVINEVQSFNAIDVRLDDSGNPYVYFNTDNDGLVTGYTRWELGIFAREAADPTDTLLVYLYAPTEPDADYIPPEGSSASIQTFRLQIAQAQGLTATVDIDQSTVFVALDRWADHLDGGGGVDQHPVATDADPGLMSAADKTKVDAHINTVTPTRGTSIHGVATTGLAGFMAAADKSKLDGIAAGAEVNQNAFAIIKIGGLNIGADAKQDTLELVGSTYIGVIADVANDKVTFEGRNLTPSSHIGSGGAAHAQATTIVDGFMAAADKTKLNGIAAGAEVNQNAFGRIFVGATSFDAAIEQDAVTFLAGSNIEIENPGSHNVRISAVGLAPYSHVGSGGAEHPVATQAVAGFMSADDKAKVDVHVNLVTPTRGDGVHSVATAAEAGFMDAADKIKLDGIAAGAEVNQNAFSNVRVGTTVLAADSKFDTVELAAGSMIAITPDAATDKATFGLAIPYYELLLNYDGTVLPAGFLADAQTTRCGLIFAPKGGFAYNGHSVADQAAAFAIRFNNTGAGAANRTFNIVRAANGIAYYQIDNGAITQLAPAQTYHGTAVISLPAGIHTLRFYIVGLEGIELAIGDWLDATIVWASGGYYY